jgi:hypothetical protein
MLTDPTDWREAARGIPVWRGCCAIHSHMGSMANEVVLGASAEHILAAGMMDRVRKPIDCIPDLSDPDTRAAYDRRLALVLGAPGEAVARGVIVADYDGVWAVMAGLPSAETGGKWMWARALALTDDPLLARALAWPVDKRVTR